LLGFNFDYTHPLNLMNRIIIMDYKTTYNVAQGSVITAQKNESIGTDGCGPCVGLIVVTKNTLIKTCGHFEVGEKANNHLDKSMKAAEKILEDHFPKKNETLGVGYVTTSSEPSTKGIIQAITLHYPGLVILSSDNKTGIVVSKQGGIKVLNFNDNITTKTGDANKLASIE